MIEKVLFKDKNDEHKLVVEYKCPFCRHIFVRSVRKAGAKHSAASTQVICPNCSNFIKTWE